MSFQLTERIIKLLCDPAAFRKGKTHLRSGRVSLRARDPEDPVCEAVVRDNEHHQVSVEIDAHGNVYAGCSCPEFSKQEQYCEHIASVLLYKMRQDEDDHSQARLRSPASSLSPAETVRTKPDAPGAGNSGRPEEEGMLAQTVLGLFAGRPLRRSMLRTVADGRTKLETEFILSSFHAGKGKYMFGLELRLGAKKPYVVSRIRELLERIGAQESCAFSKHFAYDPDRHTFRAEDDAVLQELIRVLRNEQLYRETVSLYPSFDAGKSGERMLLIPPASWAALLPLLVKAPGGRFMAASGSLSGIQLADEPLPLVFEFDARREKPRGSYQLTVQGLDELTVMEAYGMVCAGGKLLKVSADACKQLADLKSALLASHGHTIPIPAGQMETFMDKVVPGLMKLGTVRIAQEISDRVLQTALLAKLYLDRVKDRLLAGLEFHYGDIVINPLESGENARGADRILMRDGERERRILELMESASFAKTESGYVLDDEEAEYEFLYHVLPQLEKLVRVYATSAVKIRVLPAPVTPRIRVDIDERTDWLECSFDMAGIPEAAVREVLASLEEKRRYYRLPNGALLPLETEAFQEIVRFINAMGPYKGDLNSASFRLPVSRGLHLLDSSDPLGTVSLGKSLRQLLDHIRNPDQLDFPVPESLSGVLRGYQTYGYQWMKTLAFYRFGGILADDMGLGKTLQSISFLVSVLPEIRGQSMPAIVVSPASLVYNWYSELKKFAPEIRTLIADGSPNERSAALEGGISGPLGQADVILTSYPLLRRDAELYAKHTFHTLLLDEAQAFKNHATQTAQAVKALQAKHRFALTGTPIENGLDELWSIMDAVFPQLFSDKRAFEELPRETIARRIRPFLLRRLKTDVLKELPEKIETVQTTGLLPEQKKLYTAYLAKLQKEALKHLSEDGFRNNRIRILAGLTRLRQLCCHPALFVEGYDGGSAKFEQLLEIVEECRSAGKRMLIFSQFTEMLGLIRRELGYRGVPLFYLDGATPASERVELCERFNDGERDVFLISLKAGGTGLNLTGADTVVLYDLWWNPAVEQQAADRAHRMGQKQVVQVIRLITQGTVEEKMFKLQQSKKHLTDEVIQPGHESLSTLSEQELREILMLD
ncbi:Superfamily II DNA or RNA helicase, SNF2 family [Paenibacillus sp. UNCCL117]|uniref:DEAD/DEAH box helicase n=1 Tax=unclassified Paenibacillus TaxID=185978 RepID=UPI00088B7383|nr:MULTISPECIES: DEAD/DEAH box helicase [unclassified Paenibacillus]SDC43554.1 Superfamily II DNA or RNA helicase, SNF2 family [Paenibacillus sp. cl123]SFW12928.1 Superfamily II DNA or RNA helicase, SNF2 family [Paenibacillus sp. UNCCL117]